MKPLRCRCWCCSKRIHRLVVIHLLPDDTAFDVRRSSLQQPPTANQVLSLLLGDPRVDAKVLHGIRLHLHAADHLVEGQFLASVFIQPWWSCGRDESHVACRAGRSSYDLLLHDHLLLRLPIAGMLAAGFKSGTIVTF
eukprot:10371741-Heterocapsa_arctica.AAC.2